MIPSITTILCDECAYQDYQQAGNSYTFKRFPLTGFNGAGNTIWSTTPQVLATASKDVIIGNAVTAPRSQIFSNTTNKVVMFNYNADLGTGKSAGYHLGLMQKGANDTYLFQTEKSTTKNYRGVYPKPGWFDVGNQVNHNGG